MNREQRREIVNQQKKEDGKKRIAENEKKKGLR
jgi:hypothetical protein